MAFGLRDVILLLVIGIGCFCLGVGTMTTLVPKEKEYIFVNNTEHQLEVRYITVTDNVSVKGGQDVVIAQESQEIYKPMNYYPRFLNPGMVDIEINYRLGTTVIKLNKALQPTYISCASYSMAPWFGCGNIGLEESTNNDTTFNVGDVIIFKNPWNESIKNPVIHQIIAMNETCILTKGTNNKHDDADCLQKSDIYYRMWFMLPTTTDKVDLKILK